MHLLVLSALHEDGKSMNYKINFCHPSGSHRILTEPFVVVVVLISPVTNNTVNEVTFHLVG